MGGTLPKPGVDAPIVIGAASEAEFEPTRESVYVRVPPPPEAAANVTFITLKLNNECGEMRSAIPFVPPDATTTLAVAPIVDARLLYPGNAVVSMSAYDEPIESGIFDAVPDGVNVGDIDAVVVSEGDVPKVAEDVTVGDVDRVSVCEVVRERVVVPDAVLDVVGLTDGVVVTDGVTDSDDPADGVCVPDGVGDGDGWTIPAKRNPH